MAESNGRRCRSIALGLLVGGVLATPALAAEADGATAMCLERDTQAVCDCASEELLAETGAQDYALYAAIGENHLARMAAGESRSDAWTAASREVATERGIGTTALMQLTNEIGKAHRAAIKACGG